MTISRKGMQKRGPFAYVHPMKGKFLRGFVDYMIDIANEKGLFNGGIVLVKPIPFGSWSNSSSRTKLYGFCAGGWTHSPQ